MTSDVVFTHNFLTIILSNSKSALELTRPKGNILPPMVLKYTHSERGVDRQTDGQTQFKMS